MPIITAEKIHLHTFLRYLDTDECQDDELNKCESPANCMNVAGSYFCNCPDGYEFENKDQVSCKSKCVYFYEINPGS